MRSPPSPHESTRSLGPVLLLALALVLVAVLAYQAQDAARSHQRMAESTLGDYASFADWQLSQQAKSSLLTTVVTSLAAHASQVNPKLLDSSLVSPEQIEATARVMADSWCRCLGGAQYFFRYDWKDGTFRTTATDLPDAALAWARDTIVAYTRSLPKLTGRRPLTYGSPDGRFGPLKQQLGAVLTNDSYAMIFRDETAGASAPASAQEPSTPPVLVFVVARDPVGGEPIVIYGYATDPRPFLAPTFALIRRENALLPPSLVRNTPPDSILSISVTTLRGREVYRSPGYFSLAYSAADTIESNFGHLVMRVALHPDLAGQLIVGGLPRSRLPVLVGVFLLTAGLLAVALVQLRRQQQLARLRTEFVSGVSHELRTPLAQIRWFAELLHMGKLRSDEERARSAAIIDQEARRLTYLVENVLNFSRGEKGANRITPARLDVENEIREVLEMFAPLARSRRMTLRSELELGLSVDADRDALRQILLNLLDNAVKYGPAGQTITVGTAKSDGPRVRLWVEDQGPGIPAAERERVWEPYVRLTRGSESATGGSGIGLSVVRELVSLHGTEAWIESAPGGGSRVVVELPSHAVDAAPAPPSSVAIEGAVTGAGKS
jgi:signal transduction histidine kinase